MYWDIRQSCQNLQVAAAHGKTLEDIETIIELLGQAHSRAELRSILNDLLTGTEIRDLANRWKSIKFLLDGAPQRTIQSRLGISISKVIHAANLLKIGGKGFRLAYSRLKK